MTPDEFRAARKALGLTQHTMAEALRMGKWGYQTIGKWERGEAEIPGPITLLIEAMMLLNGSRNK